MLVKVAWRNIWRNRTRSLVVIITIVLGLWAGMFASAFVVGMMEQKVDNVISLEMSHVQFHHPEFREDIRVPLIIDNHQSIISDLKQDNQFVASSDRTIGMAMINSPSKSGAIKVTGINPNLEAKVTSLSSYMKEGDFFEKKSRKPILISQKLAEEYKVKMRSKLVLTVQDVNGELAAEAFRIVGLFDTGNGMYDERNVYVLQHDLQNMMQLDNGVHEIAVLLASHEQADCYAEKYQNKYAELEVLSWKDLSSGIRFMIEAMDVYTLFIVGIILIALLFSIINTMLMAVLERMKEIGTLMGLGMSKGRVFGMIILETIFLNLIGGPLGLLVAWFSISYFGTHGINLGSGAAYSDLGFSNMIYPELAFHSYVQVSVMVFVMAVLAAIYPARKALKLKPVEAIRKI